VARQVIGLYARGRKPKHARDYVGKLTVYGRSKEDALSNAQTFIRDYLKNINLSRSDFKHLSHVNPEQKELGKAKLVTRHGGFLGFGRAKDYWEFDVAGRTYQVKKGKGRQKLPVKAFVIDKATGQVFN
jgi:hypothetical protein